MESAPSDTKQLHDKPPTISSKRIATMEIVLNSVKAFVTAFRLGQIILAYSVALVRKRTIPKERPPPVGEVSANFCG